MRFPFRTLLFCGLISSFWFLAAASHAQDLPPRCSAAQLDIRVLSDVESAPESDAHWLGVEIQNRDRLTCWLDWLVLKFPPDNTTQSGDAWSSDVSSWTCRRWRAYRDRMDGAIRLGAGRLFEGHCSYDTVKRLCYHGANRIAGSPRRGLFEGSL